MAKKKRKKISTSPSPIPLFWILFVLFTASGGCGLVYEVVWSRMLTLTFGATTLAISTVLSTFMAGLGLGSIAFGRAVQKRLDPLLIYALIEGGIGLYAIAFPFLMEAIETIYIIIFNAFYDDFYILSLLRFSVTFTFLFFPTFLMGGTFPVLSQFLIREEKRAGLEIGLLYALNTSGAVGGAIATGFFLIPLLGMRGCIFLSGSINLSIGLAVFLLKKGWEKKIKFKKGKPQPTSSEDVAFPSSKEGKLSSFLLPAFFLSGFTALGLQVIWTRLLVLSFGTSIYAFTIVLVTFLSGLVLGSLIFSPAINRTKDPSGIFGGLEIFIGITTLITLPLLEKLPQFFLYLFKLSAGQWEKLIIMEILLASGIIIFPTLAFGATFPAVAKAHSLRIQSIGKGVGDSYGVNTFGAMAGSFLTGFVIIPIAGFQKGLIIMASINLIIGAIVFSSALGLSLKKTITLIVASIFVSGVAHLAFPRWNQRLLTSGVYIYAQEFLKKGKTVSSAMEDYRLIYYREGLSATVAVLKGRDIFLRINGKTDAGDSPDNLTQRLLAHLPLLLHPDPKDVLVIGLGSGVTLGSALLHPVENVDCIEISPEVVEASHFFKNANYSALDDPRAHLHILDARTWILARKKVYDVIISEPSNPWQTGNSSLFTVDHYKLARERLRDGGIICQWLPYYQMSLDDLRMALKSFYQVFPEGSLWMVGADALMIGMKGGKLADYQSIAKKWDENSKARKSLEEIGIKDIPSLLSLFLLDKAGIEEFLKSERKLHTDDRPILEFSAPRSLYQDTALANYREMERFAKTAFPPIKFGRVGTQIKPSPLMVGKTPSIPSHLTERRDLSIPSPSTGVSTPSIPFPSMERRPPSIPSPLSGKRPSSIPSSSMEEKTSSIPSSLTGKTPSSIPSSLTGKRPSSIPSTSIEEKPSSIPSPLMEEKPSSIPSPLTGEGRVGVTQPLSHGEGMEELRFTLLLNLAERYQQAHRPFFSALALADAIKIRPDHAETRYRLGALKAELGDIRGAREELEEVLKIEPSHYKAQNDLGLICIREKKIDLAEAYFKKAISIHPDLAPAHYNLGQLYLEYHKSYNFAIREFEEALKKDPKNPMILNALGMAHALIKDYQKARDYWKRAIEIDPSYEKARRNLEKLRYFERK